MQDRETASFKSARPGAIPRRPRQASGGSSSSPYGHGKKAANFIPPPPQGNPTCLLGPACFTAPPPLPATSDHSLPQVLRLETHTLRQRVVGVELCVSRRSHRSRRPEEEEEE